MSPSKPTDVAQLRKMFVRTFGADFELLSDRVTEKNGDRFWRATVKAKHSGGFTFRYKFQRVNYGYKYGSNEYWVVVGESGCRRMMFFGTRPDMCVEDAIVISIQISDYVINHTFTTVSIYPQHFTSSYTGMEDLKTDAVDNPLADRMKFLGRQVRGSVYRDLRTVGVDYRAVFEARDAGQFNLQLAPQLPEGLRDFKNDRLADPIPINVVGDKESILTVAAEEHIWESDDAPDPSLNPRGSSSGGRNHYEKVLMLRPGDRISVTYCTMRLPNRREMELLADQVTPIVKSLPFSPDK